MTRSLVALMAYLQATRNRAAFADEGSRVPHYMPMPIPPRPLFHLDVSIVAVLLQLSTISAVRAALTCRALRKKQICVRGREPRIYPCGGAYGAKRASRGVCRVLSRSVSPVARLDLGDGVDVVH